ncbi:MAG TPA: ABC transporter ATP-binding protein [Candidatus Coprovivens excrementavium]|nr:ABC transporter ATP-binding protein [Candidatus Coprovivens excrementavium]
MEYIEGKRVIDNLNMTIREGDIYAFVGRNGVGKTTTIKSIVGINHITEGDILLDKISIQKDPIKYKKMLAYVPDNPILYEYLTGIQYLDFIADIYEMTSMEREKGIEKYAKKFELYDELGNLISSYSHGMKQKLVLIAAFMHEPKLYVLDEPFVGLDPKASFVLKELIREKAKEGRIIFFSTHVLDVAEKLCNRIAIIKDGKLIADGDMERIIKDKTLEQTFMELVVDE